jgi:hypothetical protein
VSNSWSAPVSDAEAARRAGGRRRHNALRHDLAVARQAEIVRRWQQSTLFGGPNPLGYGGKTRLAREFNVAPATIRRDVMAIRERFGRLACPLCNSLVNVDRWRELDWSMWTDGESWNERGK